ncbi:response regulator [Stenotrophomonas tuberculopleuritidis]|uniref:response regulator n=1 Tax=Stenotrophomonas tuberculopleuritidis TaxID=3055079 RepID=UPI0026E595DC|nr:response regulator [Stenotrophomonas sp. 704A1]
MMRTSAPLSDEPGTTTAHGEAAHLADLRRLRRRLLFGGGALLTLLILTATVFSAMARIRDFHANQHQAFMEGLAAVDYFLFQRDRAYAGSINANDVLWTARRDQLEASGTLLIERFRAQGEAMLVTARIPSAVPWLVLGLPGHELPDDDLAAYLGMIEEYSAYTMATITWQEGSSGGALYGYEPQGRLLAVAGVQNEEQLLRALGASTREQAFARLMGNETAVRRALPQRGPVNSAAGGGRLQSRYGESPFTRTPALVGTITLADGTTPYFRRVVYEPVENIRTRLDARQAGAFLVATQDQRTVLVNGTLSDDEIAGMKRWAAALGNTGVTHGRIAGQYVLGGRVKGVDWRLVHAYRWSDVWAATGGALSWHVFTALAIIGLLWWILLRMDRRLFAPALADAFRVYESQALSRAIIDTSPVGLALIAVDTGQPLLQNEHALQLVGDDAQAIPVMYADLARRAAAQPGHGPFVLPWPAEAADGQRQLEAGMARTSFHDQQVWLCTLRDVTAQMELEQRLRQAREDSEAAREMAEAASRAKSVFVAHMSHEIRTPLNGVLGHLELLGRSSLQPAQRERLLRIRQSADTLMGIISDVLDFSKIEAGQLDVEATPFLLRPLIEQAALLYAPAATRKGLKLYCQVLAAPGAEPVADVHRIRQILNNLLSNAVKFTESGRVLVRASLLDVNDGGARLELQVVDSGIGMAAEELAQLFQPFQQADASIARRYGGSGLGLALCQQLAHALGGAITAESTQGVGSVFTLQVPVQLRQAAAVAAQPLQGRVITVLSASAEWREEIPRLLQEWGARTIVLDRPSAFNEETAGDTLLLVGERRAWEAEDEQCLLSAHARRIRAYANGPLAAETRDGDLHVSCYSSAALLTALVSAETAPVPPPTTTVPAPVAEAPVPGAPEPPMMARGHVLLVEDNPVNRELIQQQLEELGYQVDAADNGQSALAMWRDDAYQAVLTDINMPVMDGYTFAQALRAHGSKVPILAVTATALASERQRCRQAGIDDLLLKPMDLRRLEEGLRRHVRRPGASTSAPSTTRPAVSARLRQVFVDSAGEDLRKLEQAHAENDMDAVLDRLHAFKGALMMMGERALGERAGMLERELRDQRPLPTGVLEALMQDLQRRVADYRRQIEGDDHA